MTPRARLLRSLAVPVALLAAAAGAFAYVLIYTNKNKVVRWAQAYALMYTHPSNLHNGTSQGQAFRRAIGSWNVVPGSKFRFTTMDGTHVPMNLLPVSDGYNDVQLIDLSLGAGTLAITYFDWDDLTGDLIDTDIDFTTTEVYDFETVALHELGHCLGLDHTNDPAAAMYAWYNGEIRTPRQDDVNGLLALYPASSGGGGGGGFVAPPGLPVVSGTLLALGFSATEVRPGDTLEMDATIRNNADEGLFLQALRTEPAAFGIFPEFTVPPHDSLLVTRTLTVSEVPGLYPAFASMQGSDGVNVYRVEGPGTGDVRVRRDPLTVSVQDRIASSLGPTGDDVLLFPVQKGVSFQADVLGDYVAGMTPRLVVTDPLGKAVAWKPGKALKAKAAGLFRLAVENTTENRGTYTLLTEARGRPKAKAARGRVEGAPADVALDLPARASGEFRVKGKKGLDLRITGLRSPSGAAKTIVPGAAVAVASLGEDGPWTVTVESGAAGTGNFKVSFSGEWAPGLDRVR